MSGEGFAFFTWHYRRYGPMWCDGWSCWSCRQRWEALQPIEFLRD